MRQYNQETNSLNQPTSLPVRSESSIHHLPAWIHEQPMSFPLSNRPFSSSLPQFDSSPLTDIGQPQVLQQQLVENIRNFLDQQQATLDSKPDFSSVNTHREPSIHWVPSVPENKYEETNDSSRSFLFGSLRYDTISAYILYVYIHFKYLQTFSPSYFNILILTNSHIFMF